MRLIKGLRGVWLCLWLISQTAFWAAAQSPTTVLTGRVTDEATNQPLPFASVYLNGTTRGTTTNAEGRFTLPQVPLGTIQVVASFLGYQTSRQTLRITSARAQTTSFRLKADQGMLGAVTVRAKSKDRAWKRQFEQFQRQLLGEPFGRQCLITNSYALSFRQEGSQLYAQASEPLIIENQALGYRLTYELLRFEGTLSRVYYAGNSRFEELTPADERQRARFMKNRMQAYRGSLRHLLTSLVTGTYEENGFLVYTEDLTKPISRANEPPLLYDALRRTKRLLPIQTDSLIRPGKLAFERQLVTARPLVIFYTGASSAFSPYRDARFAYSHLDLPRGAMGFTTEGWVTIPNGMETKGSLADDRLSTLLPADWQPQKTGPDALVEVPLLTQGQLLPPDARLAQLGTGWTQRFANPGPSLYLHLDKPFYATGDRLWLSGYLLDWPTQRRVAGETALQVELRTPAGHLVQHQWLYVNEGRAVGDFRLSDSLASGLYQLRGFTDEDEGQHRPAFERTIRVYNPLRGGPAAAPPTPLRPLDIQLLAEGGRWLVDVSARLGIKILGSDGHGRRVSGRIVDERGNEITRFVTNQWGMGSVVMTPRRSYRYYAEVAEADGRPVRAALPVADETGLSLAADWVADSTRLRVHLVGTRRFGADSAYLLLQQGAQLIDSRKLLLQEGQLQLNLPVAGLPAGLVQLTLYDGQGHPQAERMVFVAERRSPAGVVVSLPQAAYKPRESVRLELRVTDEGEPVAAALSASITDAGQVPDDSLAATLSTHLLLTGELRGRVEQPNWYLKTSSPQIRRALDDLLLTQGWRRVSGTGDSLALGGVSVMGRILTATGQPMAGAPFTLASTTVGSAFVRTVRTDNQGRFRLGGLAVTDTLPLLMQLGDQPAKNRAGGEARLVLERTGAAWPLMGSDTTSDWPALSGLSRGVKIRQEATPDLYRDPSARQLGEVTVRARKREERPVDIGKRSLHDAADATVVFDRTSTQFANLYEMIRGRLAGVSITTKADGDGYKVVVRGVSSMEGQTEPLFLLDGRAIQDDDGKALLIYNPADMERVELLKNAGAVGIYGSRGGNGVIAFYTKSWRSNPHSPVARAGMIPFQLIGYPSVQREFYLPRYEAEPSAGTPNAAVDRRDVLYWKPLIQTDTNGQTTLLFPLSDGVRTLRLRVEGITSEGRPVSYMQLIRVQ